MFNEILKELREDKELSRIELAKLLNVSIATISHWENNRYQPKYEMLLLIADFFNVSTDYLLGKTYDIAFTDNYQPKTDPAEQQLLNDFRQLGALERGQVLGYAQALASDAKRRK